MKRKGVGKHHAIVRPQKWVIQPILRLQTLPPQLAYRGRGAEGKEAHETAEVVTWRIPGLAHKGLQLRLVGSGCVPALARGEQERQTKVRGRVGTCRASLSHTYNGHACLLPAPRVPSDQSAVRSVCKQFPRRSLLLSPFWLARPHLQLWYWELTQSPPSR